MIVFEEVEKVYINIENHSVSTIMAAAMFEVYAENVLGKTVSYPDSNVPGDIIYIFTSERIPDEANEPNSLVIGSLNYEMKEYDIRDIVPYMDNSRVDSFRTLWSRLEEKMPPFAFKHTRARLLMAIDRKIKIESKYRTPIRDSSGHFALVGTTYRAIEYLADFKRFLYENFKELNYTL